MRYLILAAACLACGGGGDAGESAEPTMEVASAEGVATALGDGRETLSPEELEAGRLDGSWRQYADTSARGADASGPPDAPGRTSPDTTESWEDIAPSSVSVDRVRVPLSGDVEGPSVLAVQILLDRALFSPGVLDGRWGKNTEKAVFWLQKREGLDATGTVDRATLARLRELADASGSLVSSHTLSDGEVSGEYLEIPDDIYAQAKLECMCYRSQAEKLAERFHVTRTLLEKLNPGVDLNAVGAGESLNVPQVREMGDWWLDVGQRAAANSGKADPGTPSGATKVAKIVISDGGHWVHAQDASGRILYHFPSTLGSEYAPSPSGDYSVTAIAWDPTWHYQPDLLTGEDPSKEDAIIPPGPNNPVGIVWMQLSKEHYGIHGTSAPETIGYVTSHGCVRLTNWDAAFLGRRISGGVEVDFVDGS